MKVMQKAKMMIAGIALAIFGATGLVALVPSGDASAVITCPDGSTLKSGSYSDCFGDEKPGGKNANQTWNLMDTLNVIINVVIGLIGFVAVAMVIVGGVQYSTSSGDTSKATKARNTIMYGIIGLVIALLAYAIVNFVLTNIAGK